MSILSGVASSIATGALGVNSIHTPEVIGPWRFVGISDDVRHIVVFLSVTLHGPTFATFSISLLHEKWLLPSARSVAIRWSAWRLCVMAMATLFCVSPGSPPLLLGHVWCLR